MTAGYDFITQLNFSYGVEINQNLQTHILRSIPGSIGLRAPATYEDRQGTDLWVERKGLPDISVDFKHRTIDPIKKWGKDDICIETCSVYQQGQRIKPGWTIDLDKRTDLIVYTWPAEGAHRRFWIVYFPFLCAAARDNWQSWKILYGKDGEEISTFNDGYETLNIYVPRVIVAKTMERYISGIT